MLLLPSLLLLPTFTMTLLLLLLVSLVLSFMMTTTPVASMYLPPFIVDIPDIKEPKLELDLTMIKLKPDFMQIKDPRTRNGYNDPPPRRCYQMLCAICRQNEAAEEATLQNKTELLQYQTRFLFQQPIQ